MAHHGQLDKANVHRAISPDPASKLNVWEEHPKSSQSNCSHHWAILTCWMCCLSQQSKNIPGKLIWGGNLCQILEHSFPETWTVILQVQIVSEMTHMDIWQKIPCSMPKALFEECVTGQTVLLFLLTISLGCHRPHVEFYTMMHNTMGGLKPFTKQTWLTFARKNYNLKKSTL